MNYSTMNDDSHYSRDGMDDEADANYHHYASVMSAYRPQEMSFQTAHVYDKKPLSSDSSFVVSSDLFQSSELLQGLDFLKSASSLDPSLFVTNYAPLEPYTILPLSIRTGLPLDQLVSIINEYLTSQNIVFQAFSSESVWHIQFNQGSSTVVMQLNIYRGKSGIDHVIEGQRCDGDAFLSHALFNAIKLSIEKIEFAERSHIQVSSPVDFMKLVSV